ncbi:10081_t:CDS:2, partial [Funneliformis geosporum]
QVIRYSGEKYLTGIQTLDDIVAENDDLGLTAILENALSNCQEIPFMAIDSEGSSEKIEGKYCYVLRLYGSLINGQKAVVTLLGIRVFFDVRVPDGESSVECEARVRDILLSAKVETRKIEHIKAFPFRGYYTEKKSYLRIYTSGTGKRKIAMKAVQDNNFETASDDLYSFHRKVARENGIQLSGWSMDLTRISDRFPILALTRDRTLVLTWDIETQSQELGEFAEVLDLNHNVFMICMTLHWKDDPKSLKQICLVDVEVEPDPRWITIVCGNQVNLLKAFALCWRAFAPGIHAGFNDSDYDWRFIMERAYHLNILEWMWERMTGKFETKEEIIKWKYRGKIGAKSENDFMKKYPVKAPEEGEEDPEVKDYMGGPIKIKISAEDDFTSSFLKIPGCVPIDVRVCLLKRFPKAEVDKKGSLKFFLKKCGLDSKADMPYEKMWKIYSEAKKSPSSTTARNMRERSCLHSLCFPFRRTLSRKWNEGTNLLGAYAVKRDMVISTRVPENIEKGKYPGAYVFPPKKGIENRRPVTGLDFASLYPSIIMAYNLSPEKFIFDPKDADIAQNNGNDLHKIEFKFNERNVQAWCVRHDSQMEKKGLYPIVLEDLFNKRLELKARLALLGKKKQQLGKMISSAKERGKKIPESLNLEYSSVCFDYDYWDLKQKALKVYMNTFYGEAGNSLSPIFLRELACGTTTAGKYNLNLVAEFVSRKGFGIKYGNTDSLYLTCPDSCYEKCDLAYNDGKGEISKLEYWTEMVKITMNVMKKLRDQVNAYLRIKSETSYLKMAYEEVLFPVCFTGKKKYFGVGHEDVVNFKPKTLFKKGIDTVKQGKSQLLKFIGEKIMREAMDINNTRPIHEIVKDTLREAGNKKWDFNEFIVMGTWRPKKENLCNNRFMKRMRERNERIPDPGEQFSYVLVKGPRLRNEKGRLIPYRVGDYMEYPHIAKDQNMEIDINYYLLTTVAMCTRFINEDDMFQPPPSHKIMQIKDPD